MKKYTINNFDAASGTMVIQFEGLKPINFFAPHDGTSYLSGEALDAAIQAMYPQQQIDAANTIANLKGASEIAGLVAPTPAPTEEQIRKQRTGLLLGSDWTQIPDATVDKAAWATYRQALRDITEQSGFPTNVTWPTRPAK